MSGPPAKCSTCGAEPNAPCVGPDGRAIPGVHPAMIVAGVREMFGTFAPPVPAINGKPGGRA